MKFSVLTFCALAGSASAFAPSVGGFNHFKSALEATRRPFISGNWKLNPQTRAEAVQLATEIADSIGPSSPDVDVALFVPYVFIEAAMNAATCRVDFLSSLRCCDLSSSNRPNWLVGNGDTPHLFIAYSSQAFLKLNSTDSSRQILLVFGLGLPNAKHATHVELHQLENLSIDVFVRFTKNDTPFGVASKSPLDTNGV